MSHYFTISNNSSVLLELERRVEEALIKKEALLFLGDRDSSILQWLIEQGEYLIQCDKKIDLNWIENNNIKFIISHGYRHILSPEIIDAYRDRAINLHISYLPWNRGASPNFWSFYDNTPKGVTIHYLDIGIDTGNILAQKEVVFQGLQDLTLKKSYENLQSELLTLFISNWQRIIERQITPRQQPNGGSYHSISEMEQHMSSLVDGWNTRIHRIFK